MTELSSAISILAGILRFDELPATRMAGEPPGADAYIFLVDFCLCNKGNTVDKITSSLAKTAPVTNLNGGKS